ncbi:MAG: hypothetical protein QNL62_16325 [Gammaproteobacteria bacterium]|nr:hypothetical protein [Gammaproteobacteria bacterium]
MSSNKPITLHPHEHDKLGILHCEVIREGRISVAGNPRDNANGESIFFERSGITAKRTGSEYNFSR